MSRDHVSLEQSRVESVIQGFNPWQKNYDGLWYSVVLRLADHYKGNKVVNRIKSQLTHRAEKCTCVSLILSK